ncbi:DUF1993 domain-containing protein [Deefgea piscis]|uniref:DUF1993 domain-containing protein n=1 Tax=Deefgea piscis TaxID=2739061 RepID=UPI001C7E76A8|nr:DUF1993 domain-containing protein [Deefgea piscis]QZA81397.1 DUF1993 domain-containing protein [Deefgea piscis]
MFDYYQLTVPVYNRALNQLAHLLDKAAEFAAHKKISDETMLGLRLAPDMFNLTKQVQIVCDNAKYCVARLSGVTAPVHEDDEKTFADLQRRIVATQEFIESVSEHDFKDAAGKTITLSFLPDHPMSADVYLLSFVQPNFYFHLTTAYAILRSNGVDIGKQDYMGQV